MNESEMKQGVTPDQAIRQIIFERIKETLKEFDELFDVESVSMNTSLTHFGMDSLDVFEFVMLLEDAYDINIENAHVCNNVSGLVDVIYNKVIEKPEYVRAKELGQLAGKALRELLELSDNVKNCA